MDCAHMPRHIVKGVPEPLDPEVVKSFLSTGIPYRLAILDIAEEVVPAATTRDSALIEAAIVTGRLLMQFLGLGIEHRRGLKLVSRHDYLVRDGATDEVKATDVGGRFVEVALLDQTTAHVLAHFYNGASKASAHFTWDSGHQLDLDNFTKGISIIRDLVRCHIPLRDATV
jgi:hypothetical protein